MQEEPFSTAPNSFSSPEVPSQTPLDNQRPGISWTASEYIAHHKTTQWYVTLAVVAIVLAFVVWLLTKDKISAAVVLVGAAALGGYGARPPRELQYQLDQDQLIIDTKAYSLHEFRSFTVDDQATFSSVNLMPLKRFAPGLTIYYAPEDEDAIIDILASRLPMEEHRLDAIDRLMRRIRF